MTDTETFKALCAEAKDLMKRLEGSTVQSITVELDLSSGRLLGIAATNALELGIDIGLLDCVVSVGFPGTVASLRQQWGRAGRRGHGLAVLVASEDALDQYFMREPETLLERRVEAAILDHENPRVLDGHVLAAAFEAPLDEYGKPDFRRADRWIAKHEKPPDDAPAPAKPPRVFAPDPALAELLDRLTNPWMPILGELNSRATRDILWFVENWALATKGRE